MRQVLVGQQAPDFTAAAVLGNGEIVDQFKLSEAIQGKYAMLLFYPLDFTFVCPSELIALDNRMAAFQERGIEVIAISIDSQFTHHAWRNTSINDGGIGPVKYSMVADIKHEICQQYGIEHPEAGVSFRGTFMIDQQGIVRSQTVNDLPIGRNMDEFLRVFDAIQFHEQYGVVCPANWKKGDEGMRADAEGVASYLEKNAEKL